MKTPLLFTVVAGLALLGACSGGASPGSPGSGGSSDGSGGNGSGSGGSATGGKGSGGSTSSGDSGSGGKMASSGGETGSGGNMSSSGGKPGSGGAASGGSTSGGAPGSGGAGGSGKGGAAAGAPGTSSGGAGGGSTSTGGASGDQHWVGTWTASPYITTDTESPPAALSNSVLRQIAHVSLGGSKIRIQFSNLQGQASVMIKAAHIALCKATPAVDSTIDMATDKALAFGGMASVTIDKGKEIWSDAIDFALPDMGNLTITTAFGTVPTSNIVAHAGARTNSYVVSGSTDVSVASMTSAKKATHWWYISGIDVMADADAAGVVAIGDSITDGRGTDDDHNNRWTDILASRLLMNAPTKKVSMMNQGIGGTNLLGSGTAAQARYMRDVLNQSGVKYVIILDGVNDIHGNASADSLKTGYMKMISDAHAKGLKVFGGTITPFGASTDYYTSTAESTRQAVNTFIKGGAFDGVIDFDKAVTDGGNPPKLKADYAKWSMEDGLHPGPAGYQAMGAAADLALFTK